MSQRETADRQRVRQRDEVIDFQIDLQTEGETERERERERDGERERWGWIGTQLDRLKYFESDSYINAQT